MNSIILTFLLLTLPSLASDSKICKPGEHWVRSFHRKSYNRNDGTFVSDADVVAHCQQNSVAYNYLSPKLKDTHPAKWPNPSEKSKPWTEAEKEKLIEALDSLPEALWSKNLGDFFRMVNSKDSGNPASTDRYGNTAIYDEAFKSNHHSLARILAHEFAHAKYRELDSKTRESYEVPMGWIKGGGNLESSGFSNRECCFVEADGKTGPEEDFANNVEYFLFDSKSLKEKTPWANTWINDHFGDKFKLKGKGVPKK